MDPRHYPGVRSASCCAVLALIGASAALAQPSQLEAVVVTGQGRVQQLQSVPIAIQVMGADQVRKLGASNMGDLSSHVPGLTIDATQATQPTISLRGIGTSDFGIGTDSPVGIYVDGVYTGKTGGALLNFNDVKRIEVLKGPQGTLFGRNSAGGAISVVTNDPEFASRASGLLRLGNRGQRHVELLANQPLGENLALRASLVSQRSDGFLADAATGEKAGGENAWGLRAALLWRASEDTKAILSLEHEKLDQRARPAIGVVPIAPGMAPVFPSDPATYLDPRKAPLRNDVAGNIEARDFNGVTLRLTHALAWADFSSTTAYRHFTSKNRQDNDGSNSPLIYLSTTNDEANSSWQQEFRLSGKRGTTDWLAGLSFYRETARQTAFVDTTTTALDTMAGNLTGLPLFQTVNVLAEAAGVPGINLLGHTWGEAMTNQGRFSAVAAYGDVIWELQPSTHLTTGLRLTRDSKRFSWFNPNRAAPSLDEQLAVLDAVDLFNGMVAAGALTQEQALMIQGALRSNVLIASSGATTAPLQLSRSWNDVSPRLVLDHRIDRDLMVYGSITRGYQAGGFNTLQVNSAYAPERVTSLEVGAKGQLAGLGLSYSASLFHYAFNNLQTLQLVPSSAGGIPAYQVSISDQKATGVDLDARWRVSRQLNLFGNVELLDQTYKRGSSSLGSNLAGQPVGAPRLHASVGFEVLWQALGGQAQASLQASYSGATRCNEESYVQGLCLNTPTFQVGGARQKLDGRIGWESDSKRWGLSLLVNNLLDKRYINRLWYESAPLGSAYATLAKPRTVAVELRASF
ncbi:TonB-dependent receptor [Roseateles toxinivorans]|uniref:Iron complex outermembrane receptor protein n=1 Tax=Roseateles toxinivorans TaxID=270368 RepID=A0A4R6QBJ8_9BURK|nr:TonB-dependent receptor [Roseateles toxinivorans]TDP59731.1 iron complex outermembrane receptor protein [Roseateles toxinivorans]